MEISSVSLRFRRVEHVGSGDVTILCAIYDGKNNSTRRKMKSQYNAYILRWNLTTLILNVFWKAKCWEIEDNILNQNR